MFRAHLQLLFVVCVVLAFPTSAHASRWSIEVVGLDRTASRAYYVVTAPLNRDSVRMVRYFELQSSTPQQPKDMGRSTLVGSADDSLLLTKIAVLRRKCVRLDTLIGVERPGVREVGHHGVSMGDYVVTIHHLRVGTERLCAELQTDDHCNRGVELIVRSIYRVPGRPEAIAIVERPDPYWLCDDSMVMLLSERALPVREYEMSNYP